MLEIEILGDQYIRLAGQFDASQVDHALAALNQIETSCTVDLQGLSYISSAGLAVLLETQQRLSEDGQALRLSGLSPHVRMVFEIAGFDHIFEIS